MSSIKENLERVKERIARAAERFKRDPEEIVLVAVSKTRTALEMEEVIRAGVTVIGENRVQEAEQKFPEIHLPVQWHLVGHLQTNKVKKALEIFGMIHSVDSIHLAEEISRRATSMERKIDALVEVNTSGESSKFGIEPDETAEFIGRIASISGIQIRGLMTVGPLMENPDMARPCFAKLRRIKEQVESLKIPNVKMQFLSMGMTADFEVAIEEGSNMVRIGTAIFGPRPY